VPGDCEPVNGSVALIVALIFMAVTPIIMFF
jgi:hypothetical protein